MGSLEYLSQRERNAVYHLHKVLLDWLDKDVVKLLIFGTRVKAKGTDRDEIDVLVVIRKLDQKKNKRIIDIFMDVNVEDDVKFIPMVYDKDEFNDPTNRETPFLRKVLREAVEI